MTSELGKKINCPIIPSRLALYLIVGVYSLSIIAVIIADFRLPYNIDWLVTGICVWGLIQNGRHNATRLKHQTPPWHYHHIQSDGVYWQIRYYPSQKTSQTTSSPAISISHDLVLMSGRIMPCWIYLVLGNQESDNKTHRLWLFKDQVSDETYRSICLLLHTSRH